MCMFVSQVSAEVKKFTNCNERRGGIPSYHLFLCLGELTKLADHMSYW